eukprot:GDKJ01023252.1.p1 GENE.GDKJ01023252.1~~GDKJ01023252.1.p1  ORF type:complete len:417 (+),score=48.42 GDKJ01023252.1:58-1308(+)
MASKLWWTSKGKGGQDKYPGCYLENTALWAKDPMLNIWRRATVITCRDDPSVTIIPSQEPGPERYEYYVNWTGYDRRMDCWVRYSYTRLEPEKPPQNDGEIEWETPEQPHHDHTGMDESWLKAHEENTKVKTVMNLHIGKYKVPTWYFSPFPREHQNVDTLHTCEFCLNFFKESMELDAHMARCTVRCPPGDEIYRDGTLSMFEVDGALSRVFCENLCFISKLFLDHKTLRHTCTLFLFYVLCEYDDDGYHIVAYFSKEKFSTNNLSCILTLPQHQRKGYGKFLIAFSYALSLIERKRGTPERPLSDLGKASYMAYWAQALLPIIEERQSKNLPVSIDILSNLTAITPEDVTMCLDEFGILRSLRGCEFIWLPKDLYDRVWKLAGKPGRAVYREKIHWTSYDENMMRFELAMDYGG